MQKIELYLMMKMCTLSHADMSNESLDAFDRFYASIRRNVQQGMACPSIHNETETGSKGLLLK